MNKYCVGILSFWIALPTKNTKWNVQQIERNDITLTHKWVDLLSPYLEWPRDLDDQYPVQRLVPVADVQT